MLDGTLALSVRAIREFNDATVCPGLLGRNHILGLGVRVRSPAAAQRAEDSALPLGAILFVLWLLDFLFEMTDA